MAANSAFGSRAQQAVDKVVRLIRWVGVPAMFESCPLTLGSQFMHVEAVHTHPHGGMGPSAHVWKTDAGSG